MQDWIMGHDREIQSWNSSIYTVLALATSLILNFDQKLDISQVMNKQHLPSVMLLERSVYRVLFPVFTFSLFCGSGLHNFLKFSQPPLVFKWEYVNTKKKVLHCLSGNRLQHSFSRHIFLFRRKTIYYTTIPVRHNKHFNSQITLALGNSREYLLTSLMDCQSYSANH